MPIFLEQSVAQSGVLGIWKISESEEYFLSRLTLTDIEKENLQLIKGEGRRTQWLAARCLLHHLSGRPKRMELLKDKHGKPYLPHSDHFISISHSHEMAAVIAARVPCGIDIQYPVKKIKRLVPRYCTKKEIKAIKEPDALTTMHVIWGAKECMYKTYGLRKVDYRKHLRVRDPHKLIQRPGRGRLKKDKLKIVYDIYAEHVLDYILTYCFEI